VPAAIVCVLIDRIVLRRHAGLAHIAFDEQPVLIRRSPDFVPSQTAIDFMAIVALSSASSPVRSWVRSRDQNRASHGRPPNARPDSSAARSEAFIGDRHELKPDAPCLLFSGLSGDERIALAGNSVRAVGHAAAAAPSSSWAYCPPPGLLRFSICWAHVPGRAGVGCMHSRDDPGLGHAWTGADHHRSLAHSPGAARRDDDLLEPA